MIEVYINKGNKYVMNVVDKYLQRKNFVLIVIRDKSKNGEGTTINDIAKESGINKKHIYKLLGALRDDRLIVKGKKEGGFYNYLITKKAEKELKIISAIIIGNIRLINI